MNGVAAIAIVDAFSGPFTEDVEGFRLLAIGPALLAVAHVGSAARGTRWADSCRQARDDRDERSPEPASAHPEQEPPLHRACFRASRLDGKPTGPFCYPNMLVCRQKLAAVRAKADVYAAAADCEAVAW